MSFTLAQRVHELVNAAPDRPALGFRALGAQPPQDDVLTRVQLWRSACAFAAALDSLPANAGRHVMVVMPLGTRLLAAHLGILLHGSAASIFTHPSEKMRADVYARNLRHAVGVLRPDAVIVATEFLAPLQAALESDSLLIVTADSAPHSVNAEPKGWRNACSDAIAVIQYSSGSTGLQKCVALSHEMVIGQCESYGRFIGLDRARDVVCSWLPLYHDMGLFTSWLMPVIHGVPVWMVDPFEWVRQPESILGLISDVRGTLCWQPNFAFRMLASRLGREQVEGLDLSSVRGFTNCSEPISARTTREFIAAFRHIGLRESSLWSCYAMAENAFAVTAAGGPQEEPRLIQVDTEHYARGLARPVDSGGLELVSCGLPIDGCEVRVVDEQRRVAAAGVIGEIALRSPYMLREYIRAPELTRQAIDADGWYYAGDLGFLLEDRLYVTGRKKDLLIVAGRNFYPQDIEEICGRCEGAIPGRSVALGAEDATLGTEKIVVLVESRLATADETARLAAAVRQRVFNDLDCPVADVRVVPHMWLLKTSSGKIARYPNLQKYQAEFGAERKIPKQAPRPRRAGLLETAAWAFAVATCIYFYSLIYLLGDSTSWNVYARF